MKAATMASVLVLAMVLGAVYAAWSDTAQVTTTASMGILDIDLECDGYNMSAEVYTPQCSVAQETSDLDDTATATVAFKNLYPGAWAYQELNIYNNGTITVNVTTCTVSLVDTNVTDADKPYVKFTILVDGVAQCSTTLDDLSNNNLVCDIGSIIRVGEPDLYTVLTIRVDVDPAASNDLEKTYAEIDITCIAEQAPGS